MVEDNWRIGYLWITIPKSRQADSIGVKPRVPGRQECMSEAMPSFRPPHSTRPNKFLWASRLTLCFALSACAADSKPQNPSNKPEILGWVECATLDSTGLTVKAKLDTGARTSSLDVPDYNVFKQKDQTWVRFSISDRKGNRARLERQVVKFTRVKRSETITSRRPVITLRLNIGGVSQRTEVNLANRTHLLYPLLIGRKFLNDKILVDSSRTYVAKSSDC